MERRCASWVSTFSFVCRHLLLPPFRFKVLRAIFHVLPSFPSIAFSLDTCFSCSVFSIDCLLVDSLGSFQFFFFIWINTIQWQPPKHWFGLTKIVFVDDKHSFHFHKITSLPNCKTLISLEPDHSVPNYKTLNSLEQDGFSFTVPFPNSQKKSIDLIAIQKGFSLFRCLKSCVSRRIFCFLKTRSSICRLAINVRGNEDKMTTSADDYVY